MSCRTNPELVAARFLLKPGRRYEEAVKAFEPYDRIKEEMRIFTPTITEKCKGVSHNY